MGAQASKQRAADCKTQLAYMKTQYQDVLAQINSQLDAAQDSLQAMKQGFLNSQEDGGKTLKSIEQLGLTIQVKQGQVNILQTQLEDVTAKIQKLENECDNLENQIDHKERDLEECQQNQGMFPYKSQAVIALGVAGITALISSAAI